MNESFTEHGTTCANSFWTICSILPRLLANADRLNREPTSSIRLRQLLGLRTKVLTVRQHLNEWFGRCQTFSLRVTSKERLQKDRVLNTEMTELFPKSVWFSNRRAFSVSIAYWMVDIHILLLLRQIQICLHQEMSSSLRAAQYSNVTTPTLLAQYPQEGHQHAVNICSSLEYMLTSEEIDINPAFQFLSEVPAYPLYVAELFFAAWPLIYQKEIAWSRKAIEIVGSRTLLGKVTCQAIDDYRNGTILVEE